MQIIISCFVLILNINIASSLDLKCCFVSLRIAFMLLNPAVYHVKIQYLEGIKPVISGLTRKLLHLTELP